VTATRRKLSGKIRTLSMNNHVIAAISCRELSHVIVDYRQSLSRSTIRAAFDVHVAELRAHDVRDELSKQ
jgi:hypothetical protein